MAKKKSGGGGANWMDTYGDMVTLLLCFFVLLYSMSTISEDKWKAIVQSFNPNAVQTPHDPLGVGGPVADPGIGQTGVNDPADVGETQEDINSMMKELLEALQEYSKQEGIDSAVSVSQDGGKIYLKLMDKAMFKANLPDLLPGSEEILTRVCTILDQAKGAIEEIRVEGHTAQGRDDQPNEVPGDRRLASERATEVTIFIQQNTTIHPARILSVGVGQWHSISDNQGEAGKAPNRRVELVISARDLELEKLGESLAQYITDESDPAVSAAPAESQNP